MARQRKSMTFFAVPSVQSGPHALFVPKAAAVDIGKDFLADNGVALCPVLNLGSSALGFICVVGYHFVAVRYEALGLYAPGSDARCLVFLLLTLAQKKYLHF